MCEQNAVMGKGQMRQPVLGDVVSSIARMTQMRQQCVKTRISRYQWERVRKMTQPDRGEQNEVRSSVDSTGMG